jgi:hypothetical protein
VEILAALQILSVLVILCVIWTIAFVYGHWTGHDRGYHEGYTDHALGRPRMYKRYEFLNTHPIWTEKET